MLNNIVSFADFLSCLKGNNYVFFGPALPVHAYVYNESSAESQPTYLHGSIKVEIIVLRRLK